MGLFDSLFGKRKRTLADMKLDDLKREHITLQQEQRKLDDEGGRLAKDDVQLRSEYAEAGTPVLKKMVARKVQDVRMRSRAVEAKSSHCHKLMQSVNNFMLIKDNMEFFDRMGVSSMLTEMDMAEIEAFINEATIEGALQQEKLATMLQQVSEGAERITESAGDESLEELMAELDAETGTATPATASGNLDEVMNELDTAIARGEQAAREARSDEPAESSKPEAGQEN